MCKIGHRVVFNPPWDEEGSYIEHTGSGERMWSEEKGGLYILSAKVAPCWEITWIGLSSPNLAATPHGSWQTPCPRPPDRWGCGCPSAEIEPAMPMVGVPPSRPYLRREPSERGLYVRLFWGEGVRLVRLEEPGVTAYGTQSLCATRICRQSAPGMLKLL